MALLPYKGPLTAHPEGPILPRINQLASLLLYRSIATMVRRSGAHRGFPLKKKASTFVVPVLLNNAINLSFEIDSGASDVSIPKDIVFELSQTGRLDFIGTRTYVIADGSKMLARVFLLRSVQVGDKIVEDVVASEAPLNGGLLLGQSFLSRFKSWSLDNTNQLLILEGPVSTPIPPIARPMLRRGAYRA